MEKGERRGRERTRFSLAGLEIDSQNGGGVGSVVRVARHVKRLRNLNLDDDL